MAISKNMDIEICIIVLLAYFDFSSVRLLANMGLLTISISTINSISISISINHGTPVVVPTSRLATTLRSVMMNLSIGLVKSAAVIGIYSRWRHGQVC